MNVIPKWSWLGASAYPRIIDSLGYSYCQGCWRNTICRYGAYCGLVATGLHPSPVPYADVVTTPHTKHREARVGNDFGQGAVWQIARQGRLSWNSGGHWCTLSPQSSCLCRGSASKFTMYQQQVSKFKSVGGSTFGRAGRIVVAGRTTIWLS